MVLNNPDSNINIKGENQRGKGKEKKAKRKRVVMEAIKSVNAEIKARGQLTIPKKIREAMNLEEGQAVSLIPSGYFKRVQ